MLSSTVEMTLPTRALASNAPNLRENHGVDQTNRVLQENSGNPRVSECGFSSNYNLKHSSSLPPENSYHLQNLDQPTCHEYPSRNQNCHDWRYGYDRRSYPYPRAEEKAQIEFDATRLYRRFRQSDQYMKYRARQAKDSNGNRDQKWPDHLEKAFFKALVQYPPMGRRKQLHKDKQRGRNELIASYIEELTGEARTRKQVSSHIQVLKPFVENDALIMKFLSKDDLCGQLDGYTSQPSLYRSGSQMSNYAVSTESSPGESAMLSLPVADSFALDKYKSSLDIFQPFDFQMFVQRKCKTGDGQEESHRLHTYTQSLLNPQGPDLQLADGHSFATVYPLLSTIHAQRRLDCNVLVADASLVFPVETWKDKDGCPLPGIELGISFSCTSHHLAATTLDSTPFLRCRNSFYKNGTYLKDYSGEDDLHLSPSGRDGVVQAPIKFGSTFWARTLGSLGSRPRDSSCTTKEHREEMASNLANIVAVQEIFTMSQQGHERLLVIHWTFRLSGSTEGCTSWRKLLLPPVTFDFNDFKPDRPTSNCDFGTQIGHASVSQHQELYPALQSPFEYGSSCSSQFSQAGAWPPSASDRGSFNESISNEVGLDFPDTGFNSNNATPYDPNFPFNNFDNSAAFDFDIADPDTFPADPALQDYQHHWNGTYPDAFDLDQTPIAERGTGLPAQTEAGDLQGGRLFNPYNAHHVGQNM